MRASKVFSAHSSVRRGHWTKVSWNQIYLYQKNITYVLITIIITMDRCVKLPSLESGDVDAEQCTVGLGQPQCQMVRLSYSYRGSIIKKNHVVHTSVVKPMHGWTRPAPVPNGKRIPILIIFIIFVLMTTLEIYHISLLSILFIYSCCLLCELETFCKLHWWCPVALAKKHQVFGGRPLITAG